MRQERGLLELLFADDLRMNAKTSVEVRDLIGNVCALLETSIACGILVDIVAAITTGYRTTSAAPLPAGGVLYWTWYLVEQKPASTGVINVETNIRLGNFSKKIKCGNESLVYYIIYYACNEHNCIYLFPMTT